MAGMFYSLHEASQKLNKTEEQVKELIKAGTLRVFYDGPNPLLKIDEVDALVSGSEPVELEIEQSTADEEFEKDLGITEPDLKLPQEEVQELEITAPAEDMAELEIEPPAGKRGKDKKEKKPDDSIVLAEETGQKDELQNEDTTILGEGFNLDAAGTSTEKIDDLLAETKAGTDDTSLGTSADDLSLDTFGSGGLLDVSLQADDTSLGGILEEIYTSEGGEEQMTPGAGMDMALQDESLAEEKTSASEPTMAILPAYAEAAPDAMSNIFGIVLFIPLVAVILTLIVAATGFNNVMPSFMNGLKSGLSGIPLIWILVAVFSIIALLVAGGAALLGSSESKPKKPKTPKPKEAKAPKVKNTKEKKPKETKPKKKK